MDERDSFDCGVEALNSFLRQYALQNQKRGIVRNYVTTRKGSKAVAGYYSLVYKSVAQSLLPRRITKGLGRYDIPAMLMGRLAVDSGNQGTGLGRALLKDAIQRTILASQIAGLKLLFVHAKDESAREFYSKHGFESVADDPLQLYLPIPLQE